MRLRYTPEAIADLREIRRYIRDTLGNPQAAKCIPNMILDSCAHLKDFPQMGMALSSVLDCDTDLRMLVCENYVAVYRCEGDMVSVARVFHKRQDFLRILFGKSLASSQDE